MRLTAAFLILLLSGCGWQLRGSSAPLDLDSVSIQGASVTLRQPLRHQLDLAGVPVHGQASTHIQIQEEDWHNRTVAVDSAGRSVETEWRYEVTWQYLDSDGQALLPNRTLKLTATAEQLPGDALASGDENDRARERLYQEAARLILQQLRYRNTTP